MLAILSLIQPNMWLACFVTRIHYCFMVTTKTYRSAEAELLPSQLVDPQPVLFHMFIPSQVQNFVLAFAEPHEVPVSLSRSL